MASQETKKKPGDLLWCLEVKPKCVFQDEMRVNEIVDEEIIVVDVCSACAGQGQEKCKSCAGSRTV